MRVDHQLCVLIVEDDLLIAIDLEQTVEALGFTITPYARSHLEANAIADRHAPHIALIDGRLADGATGGRIAAALHERGIFCIAVTGNPEVFADCEYMVAIISKPYTDEALEAALEKATIAVASRQAFGHGGPNHVS